ncbi:MAG: VIT1/CCC1 transporter family protein [Nitrososphaerales archaeon]
MAITENLSRVANSACVDEYTDYMIYARLSSKQKSNPKFQEALNRLASAEKRHYEFWKKFSTSKREPRPKKLVIYLILFLRILFGASFAIKFLEKHEDKVIKQYKSVEHLIPEQDRPQFEEMVADEQEHERTFAEQMQGSYVKYISFITLGLADAIVEISGIHAGSLGIYNSTELTGLAGIVAGAAASIAMASAAYAQAKQGFQGSPSISATFTGISYFVNAIILATPYFLTRNMSYAIATSVILAIIIIAFISYYNSIISDSSFVRDFSELAGIMLGATVILFIFGAFIRGVLGITI